MLFESFPVGPLLCNCTILGDEESREAIVIDPGDDVSRIHKRLTEQGLKLKQILVTHGHIDHVGGALKLKRLTGAPIYMNENDLAQLDIMDTQAAWLGVRAPETAPPDESLAEGQIVGLESYPAQVLHTPGHTQGSISIWIPAENKLIAGDTLFRDSIGRTDLPGGDGRQILRSIHEKLLARSLPHMLRHDRVCVHREFLIHVFHVQDLIVVVHPGAAAVNAAAVPAVADGIAAAGSAGHCVRARLRRGRRRLWPSLRVRYRHRRRVRQIPGGRNTRGDGA